MASGEAEKARSGDGLGSLIHIFGVSGSLEGVHAKWMSFSDVDSDMGAS